MLKSPVIRPMTLFINLAMVARGREVYRGLSKSTGCSCSDCRWSERVIGEGFRGTLQTRKPTQVASHAQKYFLRQSNQNRWRRRSSLFDITTNSQFVGPLDLDESQADQEITASPTFLLSLASPENGETPVESHRTAKPVRPIPVIPVPPLSKMAALDLNSRNSTADLNPDHMPLSLTPPIQDENCAPQPSPSSGSASFQEISKGESIISVA